MTMEHIRRSFSVSLFVCHPTLSPEEITAAMGMEPSRANGVGRQRVSSKGTPMQGTYARTGWWRRFEVGQAMNLMEVLRGITEQLPPHGPFFERVVSEEGSVEFFCGVFADGNWDEEIPFDLMRRLADLKINLRLDVYPDTPDPAPDEPERP